MKKKNSSIRYTAQGNRRRRRHLHPLDELRYEAIFAPLWEGITTVAELRERYRKFVEDDAIWATIEELRQAIEDHRSTTRDLERAVRQAYRPVPKAPPRKRTR